LGINVWATPSNRLTFWNGTPSPTTDIRARFVTADEEKIRVERFNGANFGFWKMQIEDYLYQKDFYLPLSRKAQMLKEMSDG